MTPEAFTEKQIERYRQMTGEERLLIALHLHELSCEVARDGIRGRSGDIVDYGYLEHWANEIGVADLLNRIRSGELPPEST